MTLRIKSVPDGFKQFPEPPYQVFHTPHYTVAILHPEEERDLDNDNVDVEIVLSAGQRYGATFMTLRNIQHLMDKWKKTGEEHAGLFFCCPDLVIVERVDNATILQVVAIAHAENSIASTFQLLTEDDDAN